jgi:hypothetical protein
MPKRNHSSGTSTHYELLVLEATIEVTDIGADASTTDTRSLALWNPI